MHVYRFHPFSNGCMQFFIAFHNKFACGLEIWSAVRLLLLRQTGNRYPILDVQIPIFAVSRLRLQCFSMDRQKIRKELILTSVDFVLGHQRNQKKKLTLILERYKFWFWYLLSMSSVLERLYTQFFTGFHKSFVQFANMVGSTRIVSETNRKQITNSHSKYMRILTLAVSLLRLPRFSTNSHNNLKSVKINQC